MSESITAILQIISVNRLPNIIETVNICKKYNHVNKKVFFEPRL